MSMVRGPYRVIETPDKWQVVDREGNVYASWNSYDDAMEDAMHRNVQGRWRT